MSKSGYNFTERLLHKIALQATAIPEISFDIENTLIKKTENIFPENHVFISGLARSGTTILMRYLYETGLFASLTYLDMPFVLMPNIWKRISHRKIPVEYKERAHMDGILVGFDSPEAFEEVFWRVFYGEKYICNDRLKLCRVTEDTMNKFKDYVNNILVSNGVANKGRYLSKNNNNVLRFEDLYKTMPKSHIIIPFRKPLQHASSLMAQHIYFSEAQKEDKFSLDYMNWLGHFEFGLNQKSFFLNYENTFKEMENYPKTNIDFWLLNWKNYYSYVLDHHTENAVFFNYEQFCANPSLEIEKLFKKIEVEAGLIQLKPFKPSEKNFGDSNKNILEECNSIYHQLEEKYNLTLNNQVKIN